MTDAVKDKANEVLINLLEKAVTGLDAAVSFSQAQIPDVVHQLLVYKTYSYSLAIALCLVIMGISAWIIFKSWKNIPSDKSYGYREFVCALLIFPLFVFLGSFIVFCAKVSWLVMLIVAPKLYLLEYAAALIRH